MSQDVISEIKRLEDERGRALVNKDWTTLASLIADDVVHVHANGQIEDKRTYLEGVRTKLEFTLVERISLHVRCFTDIAIATGVLHQTARIIGPGTVVDMQAATTQTWVKRENRWVQNTFQATRIG